MIRIGGIYISCTLRTTYILNFVGHLEEVVYTRPNLECKEEHSTIYEILLIVVMLQE